VLISLHRCLLFKIMYNNSRWALCKIVRSVGLREGEREGGISLYYPSTNFDIPTPMSAIHDHVQQLKVNIM
jgi:hypothetical protein